MFPSFLWQEFSVSHWRTFSWVIHSPQSFKRWAVSQSVLCPKTHEPQCQAPWVVALALKWETSSFGPCLGCEPLAAETIRPNSGLDILHTHLPSPLMPADPFARHCRRSRSKGSVVLDRLLFALIAISRSCLAVPDIWKMETLMLCGFTFGHSAETCLSVQNIPNS